MAGYLLDTNILSEIRKGASRATPQVWQWWLGMQNEELFLSVLTIGEIRKGIDRLAMRDAARTLVIERWLDELKTSYHERLIEVDASIAEYWGRLQAVRPLPEVDALLAATALKHDFTVVTRNTADFNGLGLRLLNPFEPWI
jgi:predicted nucleic acid-binding protein